MPPIRGGSEREDTGLSRWRLRGIDTLLICREGFFFVLVIVHGGEKVTDWEVGLLPAKPEEVTPTP